jgi:hypothetical protein
VLQAALRDECGAMGGDHLAGESQNSFGKALPQCYFMHHESHMKSPKAPQCESGVFLCELLDNIVKIKIC